MIVEEEVKIIGNGDVRWTCCVVQRWTMMMTVQMQRRGIFIFFFYDILHSCMVEGAVDRCTEGGGTGNCDSDA